MLMIKRLMTKYVPGMLTCEEVDGFLYDFHEGELPFIQKYRFKLHLRMCPECQNYIRNYKNTIRASQAGFSKTESIENVPEELLTAIIRKCS